MDVRNVLEALEEHARVRRQRAPRRLDHHEFRVQLRRNDHGVELEHRFDLDPVRLEIGLQTAAALEAVFKSVDADGAWQTV